MAEEPRTVKIVIVGNFGVGKSSLLYRFSQGSFINNLQPTVGNDCKEKTVVIDGRRIKLHIWDTVGQERFTSSPPAYYRNAEGIILAYDITNKDSFEALGKWMEQIRTHGERSAIKILVGNKKDDEEGRKVSLEEEKEFAESHNMQFFETSARLDLNVNEAFEGLVREIAETILDREAGNQNNNNIRVNNSNTNRPFKCLDWFLNLFRSS